MWFRFGPFTIMRPDIWVFIWKHEKRCGIFCNRKDVRPGRWGFWVLGFEFGSRSPGNRFGMFLKRIGLWPW